jgi:uncharacterized phiE125 gp8 family phage protein
VNRVFVVTPPEPFVDIQLALAQVSVDIGVTDFDVLLGAYIAAACGQIDGPGGWLGQSIGEQTLRLLADDFPCDLIALPAPPIKYINSIKYDDADGVEQTLDASAYTLDPAGALRTYGTTWPTAQRRTGSVRVEYVTGYDTVPPPIIAAVLLMVGDLFQNRETTDAGRVAQIPMSTTVQSLLAPYRVWSV